MRPCQALENKLSSLRAPLRTANSRALVRSPAFRECNKAGRRFSVRHLLAAALETFQGSSAGKGRPRVPRAHQAIS